MTRALVIGAGSIGVRHASVLQGLAAEVAMVTAREDLPGTLFTSVDDAIVEFDPDYVVVSTETAVHSATVERLARAGYRGPLMIEKPLATEPHLLEGFSRVGTGFNLRFHPVIRRLGDLVRAERVYTVEATVGQHLSLWRPGREVRSQYSASRRRGGGVLRDMAHEWDYLAVLFGDVRGLFARGGRIADITVDSDDAWGIVTEFERAPVATIQLNYFDSQVRRRIVVNCSGGTFEADLIAGTVRVDEVIEHFAVERDDTYRAMHASMLGSGDLVATVAEAHRTDRIIEMVEASAAQRAWVETP